MNVIYREKRFFSGIVFYVLGVETLVLALNTYLLWLVAVVEITEEERMMSAYAILALTAGALTAYNYLHRLLGKYQEQIGFGKWNSANQPMMFMPILLCATLLRTALIASDGEETRWLIWVISLSPWFLVLAAIFLRSIVKSLAQENAAKAKQKDSADSGSINRK